MGVRLAVVAVLLAVSGCSTTVQGTPVSVSGATSGKPKGPQDMPKGPPDRDIKAVTVALRELDACALISPQAGAAVGYPANGQPFPLGPHFCRLLAGKQYESDELTVSIGGKNGSLERFVQAPTMIGNTRTYLYSAGSSASSGSSCEINIPVSFERAIRIHARPEYGKQKDTCAQAKAFAQAALEKLANPDSVRVDPAKRPLAGWDACALLAAGFGDEATAKRLEPSGTGEDGIYGCAGAQDTRTTGTSGAPKPTGTPKYDSPVIMGFDYSKDPGTLKGHPKPIGGRQVMVNESANNCDMQWSTGPSGQSNPDIGHAVVSLRAGDCPKAEAIATKAIAALGGQAPSGSPQRPLLLKPDEPDTEAIGACVDYNPSYQGCVPAHDVPQLPPKDKLVQAADDDPAIACAIAKDPVRQKFGADAQPVVYGEHCFFVVPDHSALVEMTLSSRYRAGDYGKSSKNRREVSVAGHPGIAFEDGDPKYAAQYNTYVALGKDVAQPGHIVGGVRLTKPRGSASDTPADVSRAALIEPILTEILQKYLQ